MKTKSIIKNVAIALTLGILYTGCDKAKDPLTLDTDTTTATDNSTADGAFSGIFKSISESADTASGLKSGGCPIITNTFGAWPRTLTIDYGLAGCNDKRGKIMVSLSGPYRTAGSILTVTTVDFYDGINKIDAGTYTITNNGDNAAGNPSFTISVANSTVTTPSGVISWSTTRTIEWVEGSKTPLILIDDVFSITGNSSGKSVNGVSFTANIDTPLKVSATCKYIESGVITLTPSGKKARTIDFGTTGCDNKAQVTIEGKTYDVTM